MCHDGVGHQELQDTNGIQERNFSVPVNGAELPVFEASPSGESKGRIVIIHDIHGANNFYHDLARRSAKAGYTTYLPNLFVRQGPLKEETHEAARARGGLLSYPQAMDDIGNLLDHVGGDGKWGVVGFCMGGTLVMHLAAQENRFGAGVIYYGFPANPNITANRPSEPLRETSLVDMPLLGFWGDQDRGVGMNNVEQYQNLLETAGKEHEFHIYPGRGHGFLTFDESSPDYAASNESWNRAVEYFGEKLG